MAASVSKDIALTWQMGKKIAEFSPKDSGFAKTALATGAHLVLVPFAIVETALSHIAKMAAYCLKACSLVGKERYEKISSWAESSIQATICHSLYVIERPYHGCTGKSLFFNTRS
jgi:hypothetical protein